MAKRVPQNVYSEHFFINLSDGGALAKQDNRLTPRLAHMFNLARLRKNDRVLDIGCGTGEICFAAAKKSDVVVGIDYADKAIELCKKKLKNVPKKERGRITFVKTDVKNLKQHCTGTYDKVFLLDVVEHLYPDELEKLLRDTRDVLSPEGQLYIHTTPNLDFYTYGYPIIRFLWPVLRHIPPARDVIETKPSWKGRKRLPKDPEEGSYNKTVHVNEQTPRALRATLEKCGYETDVSVVPFLRDVKGAMFTIAYGVLSLPLVKKAFGADIIAVARRAR